MKLNKRNLIIAEFIPVILLISYYLFKYQFIYFTHTILGKFVLITIVMFYSVVIDKFIGAVIALLFIFYYQTDMVEGFYNLQINDDSIIKTKKENFQNENDTYDEYERKKAEIIDKKIDVEQEVIMPKQSNNINIDRKNENTNIIGTTGVISEEFTSYHNEK